jgi:hypothetical protein
MRAFLTVVALLLTVAPASAGWIIYQRSPSGSWLGVSGVYQDKPACEADAKVMSDKNQTWTGCAVPPPAKVAGPETGDQKFQRVSGWCAKSAGVQHYNGPGSVGYLGTSQERFDFEKCMTNSGSPLKK